MEGRLIFIFQADFTDFLNQEYGLRKLVVSIFSLKTSSISPLLRIWTHNLRGVEYIDSFKPTSCSMNSTWQAVRVAAGETGIDVLNEVAKHGVVVVTGGNTVQPPFFHPYSTECLQ
jgi:hypothetical protein